MTLDVMKARRVDKGSICFSCQHREKTARHLFIVPNDEEYFEDQDTQTRN